MGPFADSPSQFSAEQESGIMKLKEIGTRGWRKTLGDQGEKYAASYLKRRGYRILERNYRTKRGEVDLVVQEGDTLVFVEVKTRRNAEYGSPQVAVNSQKQKQISHAAISYLQSHRCFDKPCRFDVIGIIWSDTDVKIEHIQNAFELTGGYRY